MAYTPYPHEASDFGSKASSIREELFNNSSELKEIYSIFHVDTNEDYLTIKTIEANEKILSIVDKGISTIDTDMINVRNKANELEEKEAERQRLLQSQKEQEDNESK